MSTRPWWRRIDAFVALAIAVTAIPVVVAVVRALVDGWIPLGDQEQSARDRIRFGPIRG